LISQSSMLNHPVAPVHTEELAGDVVAFVRGKKHKGRRDIVGFGETLQEDSVHVYIPELFIASYLLRHISGHNAQRDDIAADVVPGQLSGNGLGHTQNAPFGGAVVDLSHCAHQSGNRHHVDDFAAVLLFHMEAGGL